MVLQVAQDPHQPGGRREEGVILQIPAAPQQVVATTGALFPAVRALLPAAQGYVRGGPIEHRRQRRNGVGTAKRLGRVGHRREVYR